MSERDAIVAVTDADREAAWAAYLEWQANGDPSATDYLEVAATAIAMIRARQASETEEIEDDYVTSKVQIVSDGTPPRHRLRMDDTGETI